MSSKNYTYPVCAQRDKPKTQVAIGFFVAGIAVATGGSALGVLAAAAATVGAETIASGFEENEAEKEIERISKDVRKILENLNSPQPIAPSLH